ncbi:MAG: hypothetical protein AAFY31_01930, partial [Pseudomonadota bacterium]
VIGDNEPGRQHSKYAKKLLVLGCNADKRGVANTSLFVTKSLTFPGDPLTVSVAKLCVKASLSGNAA